LPTNKNAQTVAEFHDAVAAQLARVAAEQEANGSALGVRLQTLGLNATVTPGDGREFKVTLKHDETASLPVGTARSDFTAAALARYDAAYLAEQKENFYQYLGRGATRGAYTAEQAVSVLSALGYTTKPEATTKVEYYGYNEKGEWRSANFNLPGEVKASTVQERLAATFKPSGLAAKVLEAFPEATGLAQAKPDVFVNVEQKWPDHSEFYTEKG
jgi:hypothetical protein